MSPRLITNLDVLAPWPPMSMLEWLRLAHLPFEQLKEKAYDLQLLFWQLESLWFQGPHDGPPR